MNRQQQPANISTTMMAGYRDNDDAIHLFHDNDVRHNHRRYRQYNAGLHQNTPPRERGDLRVQLPAVQPPSLARLPPVLFPRGPYPKASDEAVSNLARGRVFSVDRRVADVASSMTCEICCEGLLDFRSSTNFLIQLPCGHIYHFSCATQWLRQRCTCPKCRYELETDDPHFEVGRRERMKARPALRCSCPCSDNNKNSATDPATHICFEFTRSTTQTATRTTGGSPEEDDECLEETV